MKNPSKQTPQNNFPDLGFGLGLRAPYYEHIFENNPAVDWFEIISENFMDTGGRPIRNLTRVAEKYPIVMHGVALSIGTVDPLNSEYLQKLKKLIRFIKPAWITDHLCWTGIAHKNSHDLLPVPYTEEALKHITQRIREVQDFLEMPIGLENPSTYLEFKSSNIPEAEFIARMAEGSGCNLLLDVNNVYVSSYNHRLDPKAYIDTLPLDKVIQIHLSGHSNMGTHIIDTHDNYVVDEVWALYRYTLHKAGRTVNTMVEWDDKLPEFDILYNELTKAREAAKNAKNFAPLPQLAKDNPRYVANIETRLNESQTLMQDAIILGGNFDSRPDSWIRSKEDFAPAAQLGVYVNAYRWRLQDVTAEDYPVLKNYLGAEKFNSLISEFVEKTESVHFNVERYSAKLPGFVAKKMPEDILAQELSELENAIAQLHSAEETTPLEPQHLEGMTAEALMESVLHPRKALQLFAFKYPVNRYYIAAMDEASPAAPAPEKSFTAVFRHEDIVWRMDLAENEYHLLQKLFSGTPIGTAIEETNRELSLPEDELGAHLSEWFSRWMRNGLLAKTETNEKQKRKIA